MSFNSQHFYTLLQQNNVETYEQFQLFAQSEKFKLKIKEDKEYPNLFIVINNNESIINEPFVRFCNGIILEKNTFKIICYSFNKCVEETGIDQELFNATLYVEPSYEGTLMRAYNYNNEWILSTKKMINSKRAKWISTKSFNELFYEILGNNNIFEHMDKNRCYSFILVHNENNVVIKYPENAIIHVSTFDLVNQKEVEETISCEGLIKSQRMLLNLNSNEELSTYIQTLKNDITLENEGIILINEGYVRQKFRKNLFLHIRSLWGNTNSRFFRYLSLRKDPRILQDYLVYFNNDKKDFIDFEHTISNMACSILDLYRKKFVVKEAIKIPFFLKDFIFKIHGDFLKNKEKVKYEDIMIHILSLDEAKVCFIMNNIEKDKAKILSMPVEEMNIDNSTTSNEMTL
jgi:hypothetical protein